MIKGIVDGLVSHYKNKKEIHPGWYEELNTLQQLESSKRLGEMVEQADEDQLEIIEDYLNRMHHDHGIYDYETKGWLDLTYKIMERKGDW